MSEAGDVTKDEIQKALKAFKKRLKLTRRDDESTLGGGPLSSGKRSGIIAVTLPPGFRPEVWQELVRRGRLLKTPGAPTYELPPTQEQERY